MLSSNFTFGILPFPLYFDSCMTVKKNSSYAAFL